MVIIVINDVVARTTDGSDYSLFLEHVEINTRKFSFVLT